MPSNNNTVLHRKEILELPYNEFLPGRLWTPENTTTTKTQEVPPLLWTTVLVPGQLNEIESRQEYFFLLMRRVEWIVEKAIHDWLETYVPLEEREPQNWVAKEINQYLPVQMKYVGRDDTPRQMAEHLVMDYWELQKACFSFRQEYWEQEFPVTPYLIPQTSLSYLLDMNLLDWLAFMNMDANPHYFQD